MPILIISEKPSVALDIAKVLDVKTKKDGYIEGNGYIITWCFGHMVELMNPDGYDAKYAKWNLLDLPIIPSPFQTKPIERNSKQFATIKRLINDKSVTEIINAGDAGREGELIQGWVYALAGCKKPIKRLWINSLTESAILEGLSKLKAGSDYKTLFESAEARAHADWLFGINGSRAMSTINHDKLSVGRVQTPTLAIMVNRQNEINSFISKPFYQICGIFKDVTFTYKSEENEASFEKKEDAEKLLTELIGKDGKVISSLITKKYEDRPFLYDLTDLQREANMKYGFTAQETLDTAQSLYEKHKLITYPRTDSKHIGEDVAAGLKKVLGNIGLGWIETQPIIRDIIANGINLGKKIVDAAKVSDHHAILPTEKASEYSSMRLSSSEDKIYKMIVAKLLAAISEKYEYLETQVQIDVDSKAFYAIYRKPVKDGWKRIYKELLKSSKKEEDIAVSFTKGEKVPADRYELLEKTTSAPKPFTEATLLSAMENVAKKVNGEYKEYLSAGLGTPATRAATIEKLKNMQYIEPKGKNLIPTDKGMQLIAVVPDKFKQPELTAEWEFRLENIRAGKENSAKFMSDISAFLFELMKEVTTNTASYKIASSTQPAASKISSGAEKSDAIGICPKCGSPIIETSKAYSCSGYRNSPACTFALWKENKWFENKGKKLTKTIAKSLLSKNECLVKGFKKQDGTSYDATVVLNLSDERWVSFDFKKREGKASA